MVTVKTMGTVLTAKISLSSEDLGDESNVESKENVRIIIHVEF